MYRRREFVGAAATLALGAVFWKEVVADGGTQSRPPAEGYGSHGSPDGNGVAVPYSFTIRRVAAGG